MPLPATWHYYLKPALLPAALCTLIGAFIILYIPDPLWSLGDNTYASSYASNSSTFSSASFAYAAAIFLFWSALQAGCWLVLIRAWRYHAQLGLPTSRHAFPILLSAALITVVSWLLISLLIWTGARSSTQDYLQNPWFPLLGASESTLPFDWLKANICLFLAWFTAWTRWHTPYRQTGALIVIVLLWHGLATLMLSNSANQWLITGPWLALLLLATFIPALRQLRDMESL